MTKQPSVRGATIKRELSGNGYTARAFYESARKELLLRIAQRDRGLIFFITSAAGVLAIYLAQPKYYLIVLLIPFLCLGASIVITQHHLVIGALGQFCAVEINKFLEDIGENAPQWDASDALTATIDISLRRLYWSQMVLLIGPCILSAVIAIFSFCISKADVAPTEMQSPRRQESLSMNTTNTTTTPPTDVNFEKRRSTSIDDRLQNNKDDSTDIKNNIRYLLSLFNRWDVAPIFLIILSLGCTAWSFYLIKKTYHVRHRSSEASKADTTKRLIT